MLTVLEAGEICSVWSSRLSSALEGQSILDRWRRKESQGEAKVENLGYGGVSKQISFTGTQMIEEVLWKIKIGEMSWAG